jgi:hypothetical protein
MSASQSSTRKEQACRLDAIALEAAKVVDHARIAATHFRAGEIPRAGAHVLALEGHLIGVRQRLDEIALDHAARATTIT